MHAETQGTGPRVLVVDDEPGIIDLLSFTVGQAGWQCEAAYSATEAWEQIQRRDYDLALLDWMLPELSGYELLTRIRNGQRTARLPVIMLTAKAMEEDRVAGLDNGADDYITKPFSPRELTARMQALLRRNAQDATQAVLRAGALALDPASVTVSAYNRRLEMGNAEFKLLKFLMSHPERVFSRAQLLDKVWGDHLVAGERTVDVHVLRLRKALKTHERMIRTVRGVGYMLSER